MSRRKGHANLLYRDPVAAPYFAFGNLTRRLWRVATSPTNQFATCSGDEAFKGLTSKRVWFVFQARCFECLPNVAFGSISSEFSIRFRVGFDLNFGHIFASALSDASGHFRTYAVQQIYQ